MQIPILSGIYTDGAQDAHIAYPRNLHPVARQSGVSAGYLRPADGVTAVATGPGVDRGGILWDGVHYRVSGTKLVTVGLDGALTVLGDVGSGGRCVFDYSFDRLAISSGGRLYYWDGATLTHVTDTDLGTVVDHVWVDGYHMTTDGEFLVVTELNDPTAVNPLKYGSSEADPDPVVALVKIRNEVYAVNRHTVEVFDNVGGEGFPFARIEGAQAMKGAVGTHACCTFQDALAMVGGGRNEGPGVYLVSNGTAVKISNGSIDKMLEALTPSELADVFVEARNWQDKACIYVHTAAGTHVFDAEATKQIGQAVWFSLHSGLDGGEYTASGFVLNGGKWFAGNHITGQIGTMTDTESSHWGQPVGWSFQTAMLYNEGAGAIVHELRLIAMTGRAFGKTPQISTAYSADGGLTWSMEKHTSAGATGEPMKRISWRRQGVMRETRIQRFSGDSDAHASFMRLEAQIEPLTK